MSDRDWKKVGEFQGEVYKRQQQTNRGCGIVILILILVFLGFLTNDSNKDTVGQSTRKKPVTNMRTGGAFKEATEATEALGKLLSRLKRLSDVERNEAKLISALQRVHQAKRRVDQIDPDSYEVSRDALEKYENRMSAAVKRIQTSNMKRNSDAQQRVNNLMWQCDS